MYRLFVTFLLCTAAWAGMKTDVEFAKAGGVSLTLDAWVPDGKGPFPAVIVVHGGGFTKGDKQTFVKPLFEPLTRGGFTWFTINYRLAPAYKFPAATDDVASAIRYVKKHAAEYKADPKRIALMGESAGGYLVSYVGAVNRPDASVAAVVSFYGIHDLRARLGDNEKAPASMQAFFGFTERNAEAERLLEKASPVTYVRKQMPPFLLLHGTADHLVPYQQSVGMCEKMKQAGAACELFTVEGADHGVGSWERNPAFQAYKVKMVEWLHQTLGK